MAAEKKYYWLKFQNDFFKSLRIKKLRKLAGGDTFTIIYLKLQLIALTSGGYLKYKGIFNTFEEEMAEEIDEDFENIRITVSYLLSCGLMEKDENTYFLPYVPKNTGSESESASRVRDMRERNKQKALQCNATVTECNNNVATCNTEKEIEKEKDIDKKEMHKEKKSSQQVDSPHAKHKCKDYDRDITAISIKWNLVVGQPKISKINEKRRKALIKLINEYGQEEILGAIERVSQSDFLMGRVNKDNPFHADFDFFLKPDKFLKIIEGAYDNSNKPKFNNSMHSETYTDIDELEKLIGGN